MNTQNISTGNDFIKEYVVASSLAKTNIDNYTPQLDSLERSILGAKQNFGDLGLIWRTVFCIPYVLIMGRRRKKYQKLKSKIDKYQSDCETIQHHAIDNLLTEALMEQKEVSQNTLIERISLLRGYKSQLVTAICKTQSVRDFASKEFEYASLSKVESGMIVQANSTQLSTELLQVIELNTSTAVKLDNALNTLGWVEIFGQENDIALEDNFGVRLIDDINSECKELAEIGSRLNCEFTSKQLKVIIKSLDAQIATLSKVNTQLNDTIQSIIEFNSQFLDDIITTAIIPKLKVHDVHEQASRMLDLVKGQHTRRFYRSL
ncbi:hypothetical protein NB550_12205 [Vibrio parahaemolyticus]|jgi:hypothetical protein|uniref:hypothetical protein n=1 Tax=Vibrio parahaemolyticus TaxID=670 RepID=UPI00215D0A50|nr:hypothetical protein [Vibrio parahaemolyticus]MCR9888043.1 hypothetical protein [Vibrio parahaemolyticus]MCR9918257.1 hypothetical protein [Vibrio parahaemolyticus]